MEDFYIQQRTEQYLEADQIQRWYLTVEMLAPAGVIKDDDPSGNFVLALQDNQLLYRVELIRHLTANEAERIVEGYMRITEHEFEIETSNVYRAEADFGHPFEYDIKMDEGAKDILNQTFARQAHNDWIQSMVNNGYRYGLNMSVNEKTHPAMRPYDDLPENYRRMPQLTEKKLLDYYSKNITKFN